MANWKKFALDLGLGVLANQGIPLDKLIKRPRRRRRRGRGTDYQFIATGFREVLQDELDDEALEELDSGIVLLAQQIIQEHQEEEEVEEVEEAPPPRRRKRTAKKKRAPARKKPKQ